MAVSMNYMSMDSNTQRKICMHKHGETHEGMLEDNDQIKDTLNIDISFLGVTKVTCEMRLWSDNDLNSDVHVDSD